MCSISKNKKLGDEEMNFLRGSRFNNQFRLLKLITLIRKKFDNVLI